MDRSFARVRGDESLNGRARDAPPTTFARVRGDESTVRNVNFWFPLAFARACGVESNTYMDLATNTISIRPRKRGSIVGISAGRYGCDKCRPRERDGSHNDGVNFSRYLRFARGRGDESVSNRFEFQAT